MATPCAFSRLIAVEELLGLARPERRRRLVEDEDPRVGRQRLGDLDHLPLGERQRADRGVRRRCRGRAARSAVGARAAHRAGVEQAEAARLAAERQVLRDGQIEEQAELLVDGGDAERRAPGACRGSSTGVAADRDRAGVGGEHAGQDVDQRRLAGAVLADQRVDLARPQRRATRRRAPARRESAWSARLTSSAARRSRRAATDRSAMGIIGRSCEGTAPRSPRERRCRVDQ